MAVKNAMLLTATLLSRRSASSPCVSERFPNSVFLTEYGFLFSCGGAGVFPHRATQLMNATRKVTMAIHTTAASAAHHSDHPRMKCKPTNINAGTNPSRLNKRITRSEKTKPPHLLALISTSGSAARRSFFIVYIVAQKLHGFKPACCANAHTYARAQFAILSILFYNIFALPNRLTFSPDCDVIYT